MRITATNGNRRNGFSGQRVTVTTASGLRIVTLLPAGGGSRRAKYRPAMLGTLQAAASWELAATYRPESAQARDLCRLFANNNARRALRRYLEG